MTILQIPTNDYETALTPGAQLVDVRQPDEFAAGSLPGARNVPLGELAARVGELDPARRVVLLCRSGARSQRAAEYLESIGFGDVVNLSGGMIAVAA
jgi:rhodanese-related sulfurtransferase